MGIYLVGGEKGGTGKTTILTNMAAIMSAKGRDVLIVDTDQQGSASDWQAVRNENLDLKKIAAVQKFGKTLANEVRDLSKRYSDILIDAGGRDSVELRSAMTVAEIAVLPLQASQFDLWTVRRLHELLEQAAGFNSDIRAIAVMSRASTNPNSTDAEEAKDLIGDYQGIELADVLICDRVAYRRAAAAGMSVVEYENDKDGKATFEIMKLYKEIFKN